MASLIPIAMLFPLTVRMRRTFLILRLIGERKFTVSWLFVTFVFLTVQTWDTARLEWWLGGGHIHTHSLSSRGRGRSGLPQRDVEGTFWVSFSFWEIEQFLILTWFDHRICPCFRKAQLPGKPEQYSHTGWGTW